MILIGALTSIAGYPKNGKLIKLFWGKEKK